MTLKRFRSFEEHSQCWILDKYGVEVADWCDGSNHFILYQIGDFYIQEYDDEYGRHLSSFINTNLLDYYINDINLDSLMG